jgi:multicomponent Na+:H+ antiporter subunit D
MNVHQSPLPILVIAVPLLAAFVVPLLGRIRTQLAYWTVLLALIAQCAIALAVGHRVIVEGPIDYFLGGWDPPWGIALRIDHLSALMAILVTCIAVVVAVYSKRSVAKEIAGREVYFYTVFLLLVTGLTGIVVTGDMFNLYVFLEISSLTAYALIAIGEKPAPFSAFRYVIMGTIGACFYLVSVGYLFIMTGSLNMADLARILPALYNTNVVLVAYAFFFIGVAIKIALFPLHSWLPDAYTHAPSAVSALIAPTMTKVSAYVLVRVTLTVFEPWFSTEHLPIMTILAWMGAIAMIMGSILAIAQTDLKRMLAYSSVAQVGYIVLGIGLANRMGLTGGLLHIVNHAFMKGCLFLVAGAIFFRTGTRNIHEFKDLYRKMPWTMGAFTLAAFSMIGIPPTCGFFSKLYLILGSIDSGQWYFVVFILASSILNLIYFVNVIRHAFFPPRIKSDDRDPPPPVAEVAKHEAPASMLVPIVVMAVALVALGIFNGEIIDGLIDAAVPASFGR